MCNTCLKWEWWGIPVVEMLRVFCIAFEDGSWKDEHEK